MRTMPEKNTRLLLKYLLSTQAGFSLIESLVAVVVVAILMAAIVPMVVLTTASRSQARRVDLATQAARSYVDGVRSGVINIIDPVASFPYIDDGTTWGADKSRSQYFQSVPAPTNSTVAALNTLPGIKVDTNGNGFSVDDPQDLVIQPMRSGAADGNNLDKQGFYMAVRVYRADAFQSDTATPPNLTAIKSGVTLEKGTDETACPTGSRVFTSTTGSLTCPLIIMKVDVYPTDSTIDQIKGRL